MPITESKSSELAKLKNKMLEVEAQLREEKKVTAKLRENSEKKTQHIMAFDAEIASEAESFKWKREKSVSDRRFLTEESLARLATLTERELYLKNTISEFDFVVYENEMLHNMIKEVSHEQLKFAAVQAKEWEKKSQRNFDARIEMEDVHRHTIKGFNNEYQKEAISKMELEASQANSENDRIYTEFDIREARTNALIRQQQTSYEQLMQVRIERDVVQVSVQMQEKGIVDLTEQNEINAMELAEMSAKVEAIREEIRYLKRAVAEKNHIMRQNEHLKEELRPVKENCKQLQARVTRLCHKLVNEGLEISKKERAFQSAQIAQCIDGISSALVDADGSHSYDTSPVTSPLHSPHHSANHSACSNTRGNSLGKQQQQHQHQRRPSDTSCNSSVLSDEPSRSRSTSPHRLHQPHQQQRSRLSTAQSRGSDGLTFTQTLPTGLSSYDDVQSAGEEIQPEAIWKVPAAQQQQHQQQLCILAPKSRNYATDRNIIRKRLRELQHLQKVDINYVSYQELEAAKVSYDTTAMISFSMLNS